MLASFATKQILPTLVLLLAVLFFSKDSIADEYSISVKYNFSSYNLPIVLTGKEAEDLNLPQFFPTYSSKLKCIEAISNKKSPLVQSILSSLAVTTVSDTIVSCKKFWKIPNCKQDLFNSCIGKADIGSPKNYTVYKGSLLLKNGTSWSQTFPKDKLLARGQHSVLQRVLFGNFGKNLKPFVYVPEVYSQDFSKRVLGKKIKSCSKAISLIPEQKMFIRQIFELYNNVDKISFTCFNVSNKGVITLDAKSIILER